MTQTNRRKLLKGVTVGAGAVFAGKALPEEWTKPIVDSIMLPAHAETTTTGSLGEEETEACVIYTGFLAGTEERFEAVAEANGGGDSSPPERDIYVCAVVSGGSAVVTHSSFNPGTTNLCVQRKGTIPVDGADGMMACDITGGPCGCESSVPASLVSNGDTLTYTLRRPKNSELVIVLRCADSCNTPTPTSWEID